MTSKPKTTDFSVVAVDRFVQAIRDSGYKGTASAVSELVDNAIQAQASRIDVLVEKVEASGIRLAVGDNGCGMDPFTLRQALRFGASTRFNDRNGLGRYGMGLPNSSLSQSRRVLVYSSGDAGSPVYRCHLDLDEIIAGVDIVPPPKRVMSEAPIAGAGTLVIWDRCDRLDYRRPGFLIKRLHHELGQRFRHFLLQGLDLRINEQKVRPIDPLFLADNALHAGAKAYGKPLVYEISSDPSDPSAPTGHVKVYFSELPVAKWGSLSNQRKRELRISKGAGVHVVRGGREVDVGWFFMGSKLKENYDDWWRCEVRFDPVLDEAFGITHTKQQVHPQPYLVDILTPDIESVARTLNSRARCAHASRAKPPESTRAEMIAERCDRLLPPLQPPRQEVGDKPNPCAAERFRHRIESRSTKESTFYTAALHQDHLRLTINEDHPFYRELYGPAGEKGVDRELLTVMLLAAARVESGATSESERKILARFRQSWSDVIATYLNG